MPELTASNWLWISLLAASLAVRMVHYGLAYRRRAPGTRVGGMLSVWCWFWCYMIALGMVVDHLIRDPAGPIWANLTGFLLLNVGIAVRIWAVRVLDAFHTESIMAFEGHRLITAGPYRFLRHPLHWSLMTEMAGLSLMSGTWWSLGPILVSLIVLINRNRAEERFLAEQFGEAFAEHRRRTWDPFDVFQ